MWMSLGKSLLAAVIVIVTAELLARAVIATTFFAHSYDEPRNPNYRRAWPAFTEPRPRNPQDKLVILISNSQGYAAEFEDGNICYAHQLQEQLNESLPGDRVTVANWSIGGASGPEMLLLAARAVDHDPDLLILVTHSVPFNNRRLQHPLTFYLSDANQLAYRQSIRQRLPEWYLQQHDAYDPTTFLESRSGLVQWRNTFTEQRLKRWQLAVRTDRANTRNHKLFVARKLGPQGNRLLKTWIEVFQNERSETPVLLVSMPLSEPLWVPDTWPHLESFGDRMQALAQDRPGVIVLDAIDVIDHDLFVSPTHFSEQGHYKFARYLLPHVTETLELIPSRSEAPE